MEIKVRIPAELAARAEQRGIPLETYVEELLAQQVSSPRVEKGFPNGEEIREWLDSFAQFSEKIPALPDTISREWIYQNHD